MDIKFPSGCKPLKSKKQVFVLNQILDITNHIFKNIPFVYYSSVTYKTYFNLENNHQNYILNDKLMLAPEYTKIIEHSSELSPVRYFLPCFRKERAQRGRKRNFWQYGIEDLNCDVFRFDWYLKQIMKWSEYLSDVFNIKFDFFYNVLSSSNRALELEKILKLRKFNRVDLKRQSYYIDVIFEIFLGDLCICGGGFYGGNNFGFAFGFDRICDLICNSSQDIYIYVSEEVFQQENMLDSILDNKIYITNFKKEANYILYLNGVWDVKNHDKINYNEFYNRLVNKNKRN